MIQTTWQEYWREARDFAERQLASYWGADKAAFTLNEGDFAAGMGQALSLLKVRIVPALRPQRWRWTPTRRRRPTPPCHPWFRAQFLKAESSA